MPLNRMTEISVGLFIVGGAVALTLMAFKVSGITMSNSRPTYQLTASFDNVSDLHERAKVSISGVVVGRVSDIELDTLSYRALVTMKIFEDVGKLPDDSIASIQTSGLLGDKFISISLGGSMDELNDGGHIEDTQSAHILEDMISRAFSSLSEKE